MRGKRNSHKPEAQDCCSMSHKGYIFLKDFIYLFLKRGEEKEKEMGRNINVWLPLMCPYWGPGVQPRHVPWLGKETVTLWFAAHTQSTELHQPGPGFHFNIYLKNSDPVVFCLLQHSLNCGSLLCCLTTKIKKSILHIIEKSAIFFNTLL